MSFKSKLNNDQNESSEVILGVVPLLTNPIIPYTAFITIVNNEINVKKTINNIAKNFGLTSIQLLTASILATSLHSREAGCVHCTSIVLS